VKNLHKRVDYLMISGSYVPRFFGLHPGLARKQRKNSGRLFSAYSAESVSLKKFFSPLHPEIYLIPGDMFGEVRDEFGENIGFERMNFPFSSYDFFIDEDAKGAFEYIKHSPLFFRLGQIPQLCYLVPPRQTTSRRNENIWYLAPLFPHTRWLHSLLTGILAELILARNGFSAKERAPFVLAAAFHDIAMPAGGDSIVRIDKKNLHEENNFLWVLRREGVLEELEKKFNFDAVKAERWIRGQEMPGKLIDIADKMSYVAMDCYYVGLNQKGMIRKFCQKNPLVMDVWQDVRIDKKSQQIYFESAERLYRFLLLRAYEHSEFLLNPYSRSMDFYLTKMTKVLYNKGLISREDLLIYGNSWLEGKLQQIFPGNFKTIICPDELRWRKFSTENEQLVFAKRIGSRLDHLDNIKGFNPGLDWLVKSGGEITPLINTLKPSQVEKMRKIVASTKGYYVYYNPDG